MMISYQDRQVYGKPLLQYLDKVGLSQIKWIFLSDKIAFSEKLPLSAYKVGLSKKRTLPDQIIWASLR